MVKNIIIEKIASNNPEGVATTLIYTIIGVRTLPRNEIVSLDGKANDGE